MSSIIAIIEHHQGELRKVSAELCSEAVRLSRNAGGEAVALSIGPGAARAAAAAGAFGVARAIAVDGPSLANYSGEMYGAQLHAVIAAQKPQLVIGGANSFGRDLLPRIAALLDRSLASDCVSVEWNIGSVQIRRPVFAGKVVLTTKVIALPAVVSLRPGAFNPVAQATTTKVEIVAAAALSVRCSTFVARKQGEGAGKLDLGDADVIVSGGRGLKNPETFKRLIEPLAEALGAAVGASRAVVDAGWRPHSEQVGQTGRTVAPKLYFACGISGAIQHLAGMRTSRTIVAINKDAEAPIFKVADYGIVGDCESVLPALTEAVRKLRA